MYNSTNGRMDRRLSVYYEIDLTRVCCCVGSGLCFLMYRCTFLWFLSSIQSMRYGSLKFMCLCGHVYCVYVKILLCIDLY